MRYPLLLFLLLTITGNLSAQRPVTVELDLQPHWLAYENGEYKPVENGKIGNTVYFKLEAEKFSGKYLQVMSERPFFIFFDGKLSGKFTGINLLNLDSLSLVHYRAPLLVAIHQDKINPRDLKTTIISFQRQLVSKDDLIKRSTYFKDFVITSGLIIIVLFLLIMRLNPKLASDYFSVARIFSLREADDTQSHARLTSSSNIQFYIVCSFLLGFYMLIVLQHLPDEYALPLSFKAHSFWSLVWQWIKLSTLILMIFFLKIGLIFFLTRLFGLRNLTRIHFFNWVRLLLSVFGLFSIILFIYFILSDRQQDVFIVFLTLVIGILTAWIFILFLKLSNKSEHSMFHLFSYICATELIPLLITIKVLFQ